LPCSPRSQRRSQSWRPAMTKITAEHLARSAYVYIRQSTPGAPTNVHAQVVAIDPTQLRKSLRELEKVRLSLRIIFIERHQNADPPRSALLCP
jgi:hypothetical protein